jgi:putative two-component system response regulator
MPLWRPALAKGGSKMAISAHSATPAGSPGLADRSGSRAAASVLVVDDEPSIRMLCSLNLRLEGLRVLEAPDGRTALELARAEQPDLIVTDVMMPGFDGFQLAEALGDDERTRAIPLVFLTADLDPTSETRAASLGASAYLPKPFDPPAFATLVRSVLAGSGRDLDAPDDDRRRLA